MLVKALPNSWLDLIRTAQVFCPFFGNLEAQEGDDVAYGPSPVSGGASPAHLSVPRALGCQRSTDFFQLSASGDRLGLLSPEKEQPCYLQLLSFFLSFR